MNPENADSDVAQEEDAKSETSAPVAKTTKTPENKVEDVASAFNDLFNS
jgi:hypothetical protein